MKVRALGAPLSLLFLFPSCSPAGADGSSPTDEAENGPTAPTSTGVSGAGQPGVFDNGAFMPSESVAPGAACASAAFKSNLLPANILIVVDRSLTMSCNPPPITDVVACETQPGTANTALPTKWQILGAALSGALDTLTSVPSVAVAISFFSNNDECGVHSMPNVALGLLAPPQVDAIKFSLQQVQPRGATPMVGATVVGYRYLHQVAQAPGNRFVVLVTDGVDNCGDVYAAQGISGDPFQILDREIEKAVSVNIRTFVIGTPGSSAARGTLSRMAFLGGTAKSSDCDSSGADPAIEKECHFDMTQTEDFASDLGAVLTQITGQTALTCEFDVPRSESGAPVDLDTLNVDYYRAGTDKIELFRDDTAPCDAGAEGWQYTADATRLRLCGSICDDVRGDANAEVRIEVGCEQRVVLQ